MDKTTIITPPDIKKSVTFKRGPPDYIEEYTNHNNPEQTWMDFTRHQKFIQTQ